VFVIVKKYLSLPSLTNTILTMKRSTKVMAVVMLMTAMVFTVGCKKDKNDVPGGGGDGADTREYVDLGLPSGLLWATCNIGAQTPEAYGNYFAWGEIQPKTNYKWSTYKYCNGSYNTITKYCYDPHCGYEGYTDTLTVLLPDDDAAAVIWGDGWRMPTYEDWDELLQNTTLTRTTQNGVNGVLFTAINDSTSLFLPCAGYYLDGDLMYAGEEGYYWSSSLKTNTAYEAKALVIYSDYFTYSSSRDAGQCIRPVRSAR